MGRPLSGSHGSDFSELVYFDDLLYTVCMISIADGLLKLPLMGLASWSGRKLSF